MCDLLADPEFERKRLANILAAFALALTDKINDAMRAENGRSATAVATLIQIGFNPDISIDRLRTMIGLTHSTVVRVVDQLETEGLVLRQRSAADSRWTVINLTPSGTVEMKKLLQARSRVAEKLIGDEAISGSMELFAFIEKAMPAVVNFGSDQDVVCRLCNMSVCPQDRCPVNTCVVGELTAGA